MFTPEMSKRRACQLLQCCRMTVRYASVRADDTNLRDRKKAIAHERRRFGYRRIHVLVKGAGVAVNHKRLFRMYCEEKLSVRKRHGRKRAPCTRAPVLVPLLPNQRWSLGLVFDQFTDYRKFRVLTVIDDCTRECLGLIAEKLAVRGRCGAVGSWESDGAATGEEPVVFGTLFGRWNAF